MQFISPHKDGALSPSKNWNGETEGIFFELAHQDADATVFWHLDGTYLGATTTFHSLAVPASVGAHEIMVVDAVGNRKRRQFEVK